MYKYEYECRMKLSNTHTAVESSTIGSRLCYILMTIPNIFKAPSSIYGHERIIDRGYPIDEKEARTISRTIT